MNETTLSSLGAGRTRWRRHLARMIVVPLLALTGVVVPTAWSSAATSNPHPAVHGARVVDHASGNVDFTGEWTITDPGNGDTATLDVSDQKNDGSFSGTVTPPGDAPAAFSQPFPVLDGHVDGHHFSFHLERTGIGGTGPTDRNATYTADWDGNITGNTAVGSINAKTQPGTTLNPDGFAGARSFSAHRLSSVSTSPGTGPAAGGVVVTVSGSGLDGAVSADITDAAGNVLATVPANGASSSGFTFMAPDLTAALNDADNAAVAAGNKPVSQTVVEVVPHDAQGDIVSPPADYVISAPVVGSVTPSEIAVSGGQSVVVKGSYFEGATAVDFQQVGSSTIVSASATVVSDHELDFRTPDLQKFFASSTAAQMNIDMYVRINVAQTFGSVIYSNSTPFVVDNLRVDSVTPSEGPLIGGDKVRVDGAGFTNVTEVDLVAVGGASGKTPRTISVPVSPANDKTFSFTAPNDTGTASAGASTSYDLVVVASVGGQRETSAPSSADHYDYKLPSVTSLSVAGTAVKANSGVPIVVKGQYFDGATEIVLKIFGGGSESVTPNSVSADSISFTLPDLTKDLSALPGKVKSAKVDVSVEIPVNGNPLGFVESLSSGSSEFTVKK